MKMIISEN